MIENARVEREVAERKISEFGTGGVYKTRAVIVLVFEPRFFEVCPECQAKVISEAEGSLCEKHGRVIPRKRALLSMVLDDGTGSMRAVLFSEQIERMGLKEEQLAGEGFLARREELLGKEAFFLGSVRQNKLFNNQELFVSDIQDIDVDKLIELLEK